MHDMRILVAVDGSPGARQAVRHVVTLARGGLQVVAVLAHVQETPGPLELLSAPDPGLIGRAGMAAGEHIVGEAAAVLKAESIPCETAVRIAGGDPAHALLDIAQEHRCGAIVVGAHRGGLLRHVLLGSLARTLVAESPIPVTVVREPASTPHPMRRRDGDGGEGGSGPGVGSGRGRDEDAGDGSDGGDGGDGGGGGGD